jgi:pimeloyl-ACP methyl ester carboxylesterase
MLRREIACMMVGLSCLIGIKTVSARVATTWPITRPANSWAMNPWATGDPETEVRRRGTLLLHLPGIDGPRWCDARMTSGLKDGGVAGNFVIYDWTENDPGLDALEAQPRNELEAAKISAMIVAHTRSDPASPILITGHSGGCALAVWALEKLPADVHVQTVVLLAPALSPQYDLSRALSHVDGKVYAFTSLYDSLILYTGTRTFGTMDGVLSESAGYSGFIRPLGADAQLYGKLIQRPYDPAWEKLGDFGGHLGATSREFSKAILAPLLKDPVDPTTQPTEKTDAGN